MIRNYDTSEWHTALGGLQLALNCTVLKTIGISPLTLLTRRQHCVPSELINLVNMDENTINFEKLEQHVQKGTTEFAAQTKQRFDHGRGIPRKVAHDQLRKAPNSGEQTAVSPMNNCEDSTTIIDSAVLPISEDQL